MISSTVNTHQPTITLDQACPSCGTDITNLLQQLAQTTQSRISELEAQVRILTDKATAAVDKLADYEDQLHQLKSSSSQHPRSQSADHLYPNNNHQDHQPSPPPSSSDTTLPIRSPLQARLSSLLPSSRRSSSQPPSSAPPTQLTHSQSVRQPQPQSQSQQPPSSSNHHHTTSNPLPSDLHALLERERTLRLAAEANLINTQSEIEDLSTSLFSEANELVAAERRSLHELQQRYQELQEEAREREGERMKLQARVGVLEGREGAKGRRWEELEKRVCRVEKVRELLGEGDGGRRVVSAGVVEGRGVVGKEGE
ncbi:MAG: hypothetical protein Q9169_001797 [Polycauliona sp. 2 TL-2023]